MFEAKIIIPGLEELAAAINNLAGVKTVTPPIKNQVVNQKQEDPAPKKEEPAKEEEPPKAEGEIIYTLEQVRAKMTELSRSGKAKEVKAILTELGASNLSGLDPAKYAEAMSKAGEF